MNNENYSAIMIYKDFQNCGNWHVLVIMDSITALERSLNGQLQPSHVKIKMGLELSLAIILWQVNRQNIMIVLMIWKALIIFSIQDMERGFKEALGPFDKGV